MAGIKSQIRNIESRPGMYLATMGLEELNALLTGYLLGLAEADPAAGKRESKVFREFDQWIRNKFGDSPSQGWNDIIRLNAAPEASAIQCFFELWNEFDQQRTISNSSVAEL